MSVDIRSLLDLSDSTLDDKKMEELVASMYRVANLSYGADITFEDFKRIFASDEYAGTIQNATLNLDGKFQYITFSSQDNAAVLDF